jgi:hypothetical protein
MQAAAAHRCGPRGVAGVGFGFFCVPAIWYLVEYERVWYAFGWPTYGEGPFERLGIPTSVPLLSAFLLVCAAEVVTAWMLWHLRPAGVWTSWMLLPFEFAFWIGFALPVGPVLGCARSLALLPVRRDAREGPARP